MADTLQPFRKRLINEIGGRAEILPSLPPPYEATEHNQQLTDSLRQANLTIHLLDQWGGRAIDGMDGMTFPRLQAGIVRNRQQPSFVWVPETMHADDMEDEEHAQWLHELENGERQTSGFHFVRSSRQAFIDQVMQMLDELEKHQIPAAVNSRFLIDTHPKDQRYAYKLADILAGRDIDVDFNKESSDPVRSLENFEQAVREVQHLIIVFGQVAPQWVRGRVQTAVKVITDQFDASNLEGISVFMLPHCQGRETLRFPPFFPVQCLENPHESEIDSSVIDTLLKCKGGL